MNKGYVNFKLKAAIVESGKTQADVANAIDMTPATLSRKLNGKLVFDEIEMQKISDFLNRDVTEIFFQSSYQMNNNFIAV